MEMAKARYVMGPNSVRKTNAFGFTLRGYHILKKVFSPCTPFGFVVDRTFPFLFLSLAFFAIRIILFIHQYPVYFRDHKKKITKKGFVKVVGNSLVSA